MMRWIGLIAVATAFVFGYVAPAEADTIILKNGVNIEGKVLFQDENVVRVSVGDRERTYAADSVAKVEENEKTGHFDPEAAIARAQQKMAELERVTGLTAAQRKEVKELMWLLQSTDEDVHHDAKNDLLAFHNRVPLHQYFAWWLPGLSPRFVPGVLEILGEIDPERAAQVAPSHVTDLDPISRAMALTVLGKTGGPEHVKLLARGMVDPTLEVRIAAARALGVARVKEATPMLIEGVGAPDPHLVNVARVALREIWSTENELINYETQSEWQELWEQKKRTVENPLVQVAMLPLVEPGEVYEDE